MTSFIDWLAATALSQTLQNVLWIVPAVQTLHLIAIAALLASVLMIGLRILGKAGSFHTVEQTAGLFLPWVWSSLLVLALSGAVLIIGEPARTLRNPSFWIKMMLLASVVISALRFRWSLRHQPLRWAEPWHAGVSARLAVVLNFALWCGVAVAGRMIAYTRS
jgi:hypothetical protein